MKQAIIISISLLAVFSSLFVIADHFGYTDPARAEEFVVTLRTRHQALAALGIVALLVTDLLLPIPSSAVMTISGKLFGVWQGGLLASLGAMMAAGIGYAACRIGGEKWFSRIAGRDEEAVRSWFESYGVYAIIISRPVPMLTEILSCLAGLSAMPMKSFLWASLLGTLPVCFVYAWFGAMSDLKNPWPAVVITLVIPAAGVLVARRVKNSSSQ